MDFGTTSTNFQTASGLGLRVVGRTLPAIWIGNSRTEEAAILAWSLQLGGMLRRTSLAPLTVVVKPVEVLKLRLRNEYVFVV